MASIRPQFRAGLTESAYALIGGTVVVAGSDAPSACTLAALLLQANVRATSGGELAVTVPRPGRACTLVQETQGGWLAFLTGWTLTLYCLGCASPWHRDSPSR